MIDKRLAVITGGNRGLGYETCRQLGQLGHKILLASRDPVAGRDSASQLAGEGVDVDFIVLDVTDPVSIAAAIIIVAPHYRRTGLLPAIRVRRTQAMVDDAVGDRDVARRFEVDAVVATATHLDPAQHEPIGRRAHLQRVRGPKATVNNHVLQFDVGMLNIEHATRRRDHDLAPRVAL